jgi:peptidoglycan/xylan/chitin deacetylase (PgdA/CDA1 family)
LKNAVIITVDDGYSDFYSIAYPVLKQYGATATLFVTTDFISNKIWLWPDRLKYLFEHISVGKYIFTYQDKTFTLSCTSGRERMKTWWEVFSFCITLENKNRDDLIHRLESNFPVTIPNLPDADYAACTWEQVAEMSEYGIEIGAHTVSHPILSKVDAEHLKNEVVDCKTEIELRLNKAVSSFCYPNGGMNDIDENVVNSVAEAGYLGAPHGNPPRPWNPFLVPRLGVDNDMVDFLWKLCGMDYLAARIKSLGSNLK